MTLSDVGVVLFKFAVELEAVSVISFTVKLPLAVALVYSVNKASVNFTFTILCSPSTAISSTVGAVASNVKLTLSVEALAIASPPVPVAEILKVLIPSAPLNVTP